MTRIREEEDYPRCVGPTVTPTECVIVSLLVTRLVVLLRVTAVTLTVLLMSDGHWWRLLFKMLFVPPRVMSSGSYYVLSLSYCPDGCPVVPWQLPFVTYLCVFCLLFILYVWPAFCHAIASRTALPPVNRRPPLILGGGLHAVELSTCWRSVIIFNNYFSASSKILPVFEIVSRHSVICCCATLLTVV